MQCFQGVTVGFPAGARGACGQDWQSINWVVWSTGELRVDATSLGIVFIPKGGHNFAAKPLGCLTGASATGAEPGIPNTFVATTNDLVHSIVRLSFQGPADEEAFAALARSAEMAASACRPSRRSSVEGSPTGSPVGGCGFRSAATEQLVEAINKQFAGSWPLIFGGAELYGPDPHGDGGSEVLLGRGAVVLLDPPQDVDRVGTYELLFFEETTGEPVLRAPVGPRMKLSRQKAETCMNGRLSSARLSTAARRVSALGTSVAASFDFSAHGETGWALTFDLEEEAMSFVRDLNVRLRLAKVSLNFSRRGRTVERLQGELFDMQGSFFNTLLRWMLQIGVLVVFLVILHGVMIYYNDPQRPFMEIAAEAVRDAMDMSGFFFSTVQKVSSTACQMLGQTVPMSTLQNCASLPYATDVQACIMALAGNAGGHS